MKTFTAKHARQLPPLLLTSVVHAVHDCHEFLQASFRVLLVTCRHEVVKSGNHALKKKSTLEPLRNGDLNSKIIVDLSTVSQ